MRTDHHTKYITLESVLRQLQLIAKVRSMQFSKSSYIFFTFLYYILYLLVDARFRTYVHFSQMQIFWH